MVCEGLAKLRAKRLTGLVVSSDKFFAGSSMCQRVARPLVPRLRGLCAIEELAHNGFAPARQDGRVPRPLVPCLRGLCAIEKFAHNGLGPACALLTVHGPTVEAVELRKGPPERARPRTVAIGLWFR